PPLPPPPLFPYTTLFRSQGSLFAKPLETIRQFRTFLAFVSELGHEHGERLGIAGDPQRPGVHRIEADVADQAAIPSRSPCSWPRDRKSTRLNSSHVSISY